MIKQLGHVCLFTNQLPVLLAFYRDRLGLAVKFMFTGADGEDFGCFLAVGGRTFIEIFDQQGAARQWGGATAPLRPNDSTHYGHFCLEVAGLEDFVAKLQAGGLEVTPVKVGMDHSKQAWLSDPDGNRIELHEYTPRSWQL